SPAGAAPDRRRRRLRLPVRRAQAPGDTRRRLTDHGGTPMSDVTSDYRQARMAAALFDLSDRGKVEVTGSEAPNFLHNLCTNDVVNLPVGGGCEAFFTTAKAKVVAHALIYHVRPGEGRDALW